MASTTYSIPASRLTNATSYVPIAVISGDKSNTSACSQRIRRLASTTMSSETSNPKRLSRCTPWA